MSIVTRTVNALYAPIEGHAPYRLYVVPRREDYELEGDVPQPGLYGRARLAARSVVAWMSRIAGVRMLLIRRTSDVPWKVARKDAKDVVESIDYQKVVDLRAEMLRKRQEGSDDPNVFWGAWKFLDVDLWVPVNLERVYHLDLHASEPLDVLDISGGAGYFSRICQHFGHRVHTTDIDRWEEFNEMTRILELERSVLWVEPMTPIPSYGRKFDLITSFMIAFNFPGDDERRWGVDEWDFLLRDLEENHLKEKGTIHLLLNPLPDGGWYSPELLELFRSRGAEVDGAEVVFRK